jgi:hypothetical protein
MRGNKGNYQLLELKIKKITNEYGPNNKIFITK